MYRKILFRMNNYKVPQVCNTIKDFAPETNPNAYGWYACKRRRFNCHDGQYAKG